MPVELDAQIHDAVRRVWGYDRLRPLQAEAVRAGFERRDSLVVMPTGGGKSLCYQVPPLLAERTDVVVSPLISLMKDQVDGLRECGYPAVALHSGMSMEALRAAEGDILERQCRLVLVAPERLMTPRFLGLLRQASVQSIAVDEAHCISHWGHDFRPEYRRLGELRRQFPQASVHGYTATATPRVRDDIVQQLGLRDALVLVGRFDRPNLIYRVVPRVDVFQQVREVIARHAGQAVIVYCISRSDTEGLAGWLQSVGVKAAAYHAGLNPETRRRTQDAFAQERLDVVVATVAFGMGIDRSDVRCVIHAAMPKSIEHYQQETGRAGRDGLEAECVLFYSAADALKWESILGRPREDGIVPPEMFEQALGAQLELLGHMRQFCSRLECRHRRLSNYFGQEYEAAKCEACDICLGEIEGVEDATVTAQKILSCVARVEQRFGVGHVVDVLMGARTERVRQFAHERLSTYALLKDLPNKQLTNFVYQLLDQGILERSLGERPLLKLNPASWEVMRGKRPVYFVKPREDAPRQTQAERDTWERVDRELFESLRRLRRQFAEERGVAPFVVFSDATLRDMARRKPATAAQFLEVHGVGERKLADLGKAFLAHIADYCRQRGESPGTFEEPQAAPSRPRIRARQIAYDLFAEGRPLAEVSQVIERALGTTAGYLCDYIGEQQPQDVSPWVDEATLRRVNLAAERLGSGPLRPIFEELEGSVPYEEIRIALACRRARSPGAQRAT